MPRGDQSSRLAARFRAWSNQVDQNRSLASRGAHQLESMARKPLRSQLNQIRAWVRQGRTDAWIAHQLDIPASELREFRRRHELAPEQEGGDLELRAEIEAEIEATLDEEAEAEEEQEEDEEAEAEEEGEADADAEGGDNGKAPAGR